MADPSSFFAQPRSRISGTALALNLNIVWVFSFAGLIASANFGSAIPRIFLNLSSLSIVIAHQASSSLLSEVLVVGVLEEGN